MTKALIPRRQALKLIIRHALPGKPERVAPFEAADRIASHNVTAFCNVPEQPCSLRDGYAVRTQDIENASSLHPVRLAVTQTVRAESRPGAPIEPGQAARVLTGGVVPQNGNAVLAEEDVEITGDAITVSAPVRPGWFVRPVGGEIEMGAVITRAGETITPQAAAVMVRTRSGSIHVHPQVRARVLALGSELEDPACEGVSTQARFPADNLVLAGGLLRQSGALITETGVLPDNPDLLVETLSADLPEIVVTTGGTGNSERDFARPGAEKAGFTTLFQGADIRPGKNLFAAVRDNTLLFGLPGPPAAVFAGFHGLVLPALRRMRGLPDPKTPLMARFKEGLSVRPGSEWIVPCRLHRDGATLTAEPLIGKHTPPMLALGQAHGAALIPGGQGVLPGDEVEIVVSRME
jgi:molybdopterin molybdotransferase